VENYLKQGKTPAWIAREMKIPSSTLYNWLERWAEEEKRENMKNDIT